jgi:DNA-directed RNA polymerase specialized sigma24 family protein
MDDVVLGAGASTDGELLDRTIAGDREAFGVLYERRHDLVLAFLLKRTRNPEVAMDLMAETFAAALVALLDRPPAIVNNHGRVESTARERLALEPVQIDDSDVELVLRTAAETDLLIRLSEELPADQFDALRARVLDERGYDEIARELECSSAVVRKRVSRAIATLRGARQAST